MADWIVTTLENCTDILGDGLHGTPKYTENGEYAFINGNNLVDGEILIKRDTKRVDFSQYEKYRKPLTNRTLFVSINGTLGNVGIYNFEKIILGKSACYFNVKKSVDKDFIYYVALSPVFRRYLESNATGTTIKNISLKQMREYEFLLPPIEVQKKISSILKRIDAKIKSNKLINDNLEQQAQAIYHERFETVSPNDLPSDWRIVTLGEVATISNKSFNPLKEPEILLEHYSIPAFDEARFPVFELSTSIKSNKFIIDASCFMISKLNPTTKRVWKPYCLTGNAVCSTEFIVYKAKDKSITNFLYSVIDSGSFSDFMCSHVTGSTGSRQRTTPSDTLSYELILPSEDELAEFQSLVSPMYAQIRINTIENDKLKRLRDSLLPKLMSGEIDVSAVQL